MTRLSSIALVGVGLVSYGVWLLLQMGASHPHSVQGLLFCIFIVGPALMIAQGIGELAVGSLQEGASKLGRTFYVGRLFAVLAGICVAACAGYIVFRG